MKRQIFISLFAAALLLSGSAQLFAGDKRVKDIVKNALSGGRLEKIVAAAKQDAHGQIANFEKLSKDEKKAKLKQILKETRAKLEKDVKPAIREKVKQYKSLSDSQKKALRADAKEAAKEILGQVKERLVEKRKARN